MKSKFVKSMVGLTCLLGVNAASASNEVVIEDNAAATCENGDCGKAKYAGFYAGLGFDWARTSSKIWAERLTTLRFNHFLGSSLGRRSKNIFGADIRAGYRHYLTGGFFGLVEAFCKIGKNSNADFEERLSFIGKDPHNPNALKLVSKSFKGKISQKGVVPGFALGLGGYVCPLDLIVYGKVAIARIKTDCDWHPNKGNEVHQSTSGAQAMIILGVEKKVHSKVGVAGEVYWVPEARKRQSSEVRFNGGASVNTLDGTLYAKRTGGSLVLTYNF